MSTVSLPPTSQKHTYKSASTDLTPLGPPVATRLGPADGGAGPFISPFPTPTSANPALLAQPHTHDTDNSFSHAPAKLPPHYESIPRSQRPARFQTVEASSSTASVQAIQNKEKQALRDAWAKQDLAHPAEVNKRHVDSHRSSSSAQPSSSGSGSHRSSGHTRTSSNTSPTKSARQSGAPGLSELGYRGSLPAGMDIQEALARCEDPTLGWSLTFWVTIADPVTQHVFFACPASGQCSWDPPVGAFVVPRSPDGEWWELADSSRGNRSYYYNTLTGRTQWTRPSDAFVIPLGLIQQNALPSRPHQRTALSEPSHLTPSKVDGGTSNVLPAPPLTPRSGPRPPPSPRVTPGRQGSSHSDTMNQSPPLITPTPSFSDGSAIGVVTSATSSGLVGRSDSEGDVFRQAALPRTRLSMVEEDAGNETDRSDASGPNGGWWEKRRSRMSGSKASPYKNGSKPRMLPVTAEEASEWSSVSGQLQVTLPTSNVTIERGSELPKDRPSSPIFVDAVKTKRMSTGLHPLLPSAISSEIQNFQADDFASKYFATKRSGMLRSRVPLSRIMEWQRQPISQPLLVLSKALAKDATTTFRVVQHAMGERDRPVDSAKIMSTVQRDVRAANRSRHSIEKMVVLEEVRWMLHVGVTAGEMRDEIYSQLIKQLTKNPDHDATVLGFQLFCVLVNSFAPSKNFEVFVRNFLRKEIIGSDGISVMCRYCMTKLETIIERGGRGRVLTVGEIEHASDAAFYPTVYGEKLERIMELQEQSYPGSQIPIVLTFLTNGILALGGLASEGIFRVPGDGDCVAELKSRIDRGHYRLEDIDDPHEAASLFKQWLRELAVPLIPEDLYNAALTASKSTADTLAFVFRLPVIHRRVLVHVISFIQLFLSEEVIAETKMTPQNLALVLAPNILRTTSNHLETVFTNSSFESNFVLRLLEHLEPDKVDPDFVPVHGVSAT